MLPYEERRLFDEIEIAISEYIITYAGSSNEPDKWADLNRMLAKLKRWRANQLDKIAQEDDSLKEEEI